MTRICLAGGLIGFCRRNEGTTTLLSLYFLLISLVMGGLSIDFNKLMSDRTHMQITSEAVAHAALYARETESASTARDYALTVAGSMLPAGTHGQALTANDIVFGTWDPETLSFSPSNDSKNAVRVSAQRLAVRGNPVHNILLNMVGRDTFDVARSTTYTIHHPSCFREGFVAEGIVDIQSGNSFTKGFCVHSNTYVSLNSNNFFEPGTVVSMPDSGDVDLPKSGFDTNLGLALALRDGIYRMRLLNRLPRMIAEVGIAGSDTAPDFLQGSAITLGLNTISPADMQPFRAHRVTCHDNGQLTLDPGIYANVVLVTNCKIKLQNGVILEDTVVATTDTSARSINSPAGFQLGRDDNCAAGGGAVLMTLGGVEVAADLQIYGGQVLAMGDISFAANAEGIQGASMVSYGRIDGTSNMSMGHCQGGGMEMAYQADYFRMVE